MIDDFVDVHVATPPEACMDRDVKGLYARAKSGQIAEFTGICQSYEPSATPELRIDTSQSSIEQCVSTTTTKLIERGYLWPEGSPSRSTPASPRTACVVVRPETGRARV